MPVYALKHVYKYKPNEPGGAYDNGPLPVPGVVTVDTSHFSGDEIWGLFQSAGGTASKVAGNAQLMGEGWNQNLDDWHAYFNLDPEFGPGGNPLIFVGLIGATPGDDGELGNGIPDIGRNLGDGALSVEWVFEEDGEAPVQVFVAFGDYMPEGGDPIDPPEPPEPVCFWMNLVNARQDCEIGPEPEPEPSGGTFDDPYDLGSLDSYPKTIELGPLSAGQVQWLKFSHSFELSNGVGVSYTRADWYTPERIIFVFNSSGTPMEPEDGMGDGSTGFYGEIPFGNYMIAVAPLGASASAPFIVTTPPGVAVPEATMLSAEMRV